MSLIIEPARRSILDVIQYNLRAAGRKTYVTRVVYFGEYLGSHGVLRKRMESIIQDLQVDYGDTPITGLLLVYPTCYIHILETREDIIYKHHQLMYTTGSDEYKFGKAIPLPSYHHVHQRFFTGWCHVYTIPPTLLRTLEGDALEDIQKQVSTCLIKVYSLCEYVANVVREKSIDVQDALLNLGGAATGYLPESTLVEFLLNAKSPVLKTVEDHLQIYSDVLPSAFWDGKSCTRAHIYFEIWNIMEIIFAHQY